MDAQRLTTEGASRPLSVLPALILTASARVFFRLSLLAALNWLPPSGRAGGTSTSQGHPLTVFAERSSAGTCASRTRRRLCVARWHRQI